MKKIIKYFLVFLLTHSVYSQEKGERIYSFTIDEFNFYKYELGFKVKATKNFKAIKNETPEGLMQSIISCSNEEWNAYNTLGGKDNAQKDDEEYYNDVKRMDIDKNYFELKHKIEFDIDNIPTVIIKFYFISEDNTSPQAGLTVMQKYDNRWYKTSMKMVSNLSMIILKIKTAELEKIINGNINSPELLQINKKVFINGRLDFDKLKKEMDSWYDENTKENILKKQYFKDTNSIL